MEFRTVTDISHSDIKISHSDSLMMIGSCFIENISRKLSQSKFDVLANPFGVLYNPQSISQALKMLTEERILSENDIFEHNGLYHSFYHHSSFSDISKQVCLQNINHSLAQAAGRLRNTDTLFITFGTAYSYILKKSGEVVGNCHKLPAFEFDRKRLDENQIIETWIPLIELLKKINPHLKIIFTISPIRHLKDGAHDNQLSKATLLLAVNHLVEKFAHTSYFPSYELVMDDLRDYRFYAEDMTHLNETAIKYIWERFGNTYFTETTKQIISEWTKLASALNHRPFNANTTEYKHFLEQTLLKINIFSTKYPYIYCRNEIKSLNQALSEIN